MKVSQALMKQAGVLPKLRLGNRIDKGVIATGPHTVKILEDKIVRGSDPQNGKEVEYVRYILEENGEKKFYDTKLKDKNGELSYLVQRLSEVPEGSEIILEMKKRGIKNYISVSAVTQHGEVEVDDEQDVEILEEPEKL